RAAGGEAEAEKRRARGQHGTLCNSCIMRSQPVTCTRRIGPPIRSSFEEEEPVQVKCFGCAELVEADDADAVTDAFVAHGRARRAWSHPEEAIRNYARNYAEAADRLTGATDRLPTIGDVAVHPVTEDRVDDWLRFFDHDAFAGNPDWAACYCLEP